MKKIFIPLIALTTTLTSSLFAQEVEPCHQPKMHQEALEAMTPTERAEYEQMVVEKEIFIAEFIENNPQVLTNSGSRNISYIIPVVFHIIHNNGPENISNEQVEDAIKVMNEDFQMLNADVNNVHSNFAHLVADIEIEFVLAKKDPNGDCTNGITRTQSTLTNGAGHFDRINIVQQNHGTWPGNQYMNVFVAADIGGAAGYTNYPGVWGSGMNNGIHVLHNYVGSIGTSSNFNKRTMTHEVGHWLDLPHLWGNSNTPGVQSNCQIDDGIADTPNTIGWTSCNVNGSTCGSLDNVENFLEYSYCSKMFTLGQKARMHAALNSSTGGRNNVVSQNNLIQTGVQGNTELCTADFNAPKTVICPGESITFEDMSFHSPNGWQWTFQGGQPAQSTDQNPQVVYNTPGTYSVTLTSTDGVSSDTETRNAFITVLPHGSSLPFNEDFENFTNINNSPWFTESDNANGNFQVINNAAYSGNQSVRINNFNLAAGTTSELISSPFDLSGVTDEVTLSFRYSYKRKQAGNSEALRVSISNNCGETWAVRRVIANNNLGTDVQSTPWTPQSQDDWVTVHVTNITSQFWVDDLRVKFTFESDGGNNLYIDDINIYKAGPDQLSVDNTQEISNFKVFPNPASKEINVVFDAQAGEETMVNITNMLGKNVKTELFMPQSGSNQLKINTTDLNKGVYILQLNNGNSTEKRKIIIE